MFSFGYSVRISSVACFPSFVARVVVIKRPLGLAIEWLDAFSERGQRVVPLPLVGLGGLLVLSAATMVEIHLEG